MGSSEKNYFETSTTFRLICPILSALLSSASLPASHISALASFNAVLVERHSAGERRLFRPDRRHGHGRRGCL
jgi:hypothetical protein